MDIAQRLILARDHDQRSPWSAPRSDRADP